MNAKAVQVIVVPAHEQLDDPMQVRYRQAVRKPNPSPDSRMNVPQQQLQPQQQRRALFDHRPTLDHYAKLCPRFVMGSRSANSGDAEAGAATTVGLWPPFVALASALIGGWSMGMCVIILPRPLV